MQIAKVVGRTTATVKHETLAGQRLLIVQPLDAKGQADGEPQIAIDNIGGRQGDTVLLTSDGAAVRDLVKKENTPIRWAVIGIPDS
ncbi:MAG: EutN/CcmL family microcompartment protein [Planctomycetes bacterium]|nr:EutN/CcmL family microcompartment protein [Planctomycetota bacterium]